MQIIVKVDDVTGGYDVHVHNVKEDEKHAQRAIASTPRQAGLRAGELVRDLIEAEYVKTANK